MDQKYVFHWFPIEAIPLFSAAIDILLEETDLQHNYFMYLIQEKYILDNLSTSKIIDYYNDQLSKIMYYEAQAEEWAANKNNLSVKSIADTLKNKIALAKKASQSIINLALKCNQSNEMSDNLGLSNEDKMLQILLNKGRLLQ